MSRVLMDILTALNLLADDVLVLVNNLIAKYPNELDKAGDEFVAWFTEAVKNLLTSEAAKAIGLGIWQELTSGRPGYDADHGAGA